MEIQFDTFTLDTFATVEHKGNVSALYAGWVMLESAPGHDEVQGELLGSYLFELFELHNANLSVSKTKFSQLLRQCERGIANCRIERVLSLKDTERHRLARELVIKATKVLLKDQLKMQDELQETKMLSNTNGSRQPDALRECYLQGTKLPSCLDTTHMGTEKSNFNVWVSATPGGGLAFLGIGS